MGKRFRRFPIKKLPLHVQIILFYILKKCFLFLDILVPKDECIAIFASKSGKCENANIYLPWRRLKDSKKFKAFLVSRSENTSSKINLYSLRGLWIVLRARYVFLTHGPNDIFYAHYSNKKIVTYVGHGVPLKAFVFTNHNMNIKEKFKHSLEVPTFSKFVASSDADRSRLIHCFNCSEDDVIVTGLPRNDLLFESTDQLKREFPNKKLVLYAPTYRDYQKFKFFPFEDFDLESFDSFLDKHNIHIFLRAHVNDRTKKKVESLKNISYLSSEEYPEIQELLNEFDCLITDYSSIYIDFLLLNRPIIFIPYDIEIYKRRRGIMYPYEQVTPGFHVNSLSEFKKALTDNDSFSDQRLKTKEMFHKYEKGNTDRLLSQVLGSSFAQ